MSTYVCTTSLRVGRLPWCAIARTGLSSTRHPPVPHHHHPVCTQTLLVYVSTGVHQPGTSFTVYGANATGEATDVPYILALQVAASEADLNRTLSSSVSCTAPSSKGKIPAAWDTTHAPTGQTHHGAPKTIGQQEPLPSAPSVRKGVLLSSKLVQSLKRVALQEVPGNKEGAQLLSGRLKALMNVSGPPPHLHRTCKACPRFGSLSAPCLTLA